MRSKSIVDILLDTFDNADFASSKCEKCSGIMCISHQCFAKLPR